MTFLTSLDVFIGLVVIYLILSLASTVFNEWLDTMFLTRAKFLRGSVGILLGGTLTVDTFYSHPLIKDLCRGRNTFPTYLSPATFREVLFALLNPQSVVTDLNRWITVINGLPATGDLKVKLLNLAHQALRTAGSQTAQLKTFEKKVDDWFQEGMERTTDWYKRRVQLWTFLTGVTLCLSLNVDTLAISRYLFNNVDAREAYVQAADRIIKQTSPDSLKRVLTDTTLQKIPQARQQLGSLVTNVRAQLTQNTSLPLGWQSVTVPPFEQPFQEQFSFWFTKLLGLLLTVAAISAGAPFWFDTLKNVMTIRNAVRQFTVDKQTTT